LIATPPRATATATTLTGSCRFSANGAVHAVTGCIVEHEYDPHSLDGGPPFFGVWEWPRATTPKEPVVQLRFVRLVNPPVIGLQPPTAFLARARVAIGSDEWEASTSPRAGSMGNFKITITSAVAVGRGNPQLYEIHGTVEAMLLPDWRGTNRGAVYLRADF
jgi:hypothetical protein